MQPRVRACVPTVAVLGLFCRGCLGRTRNSPGRSFSTLPRQMSRWNSQETCSPPPPQENPRVLITGDNKYPSVFSTQQLPYPDFYFQGKTEFSTAP